ncbi:MULTISPECIES: Asp23/Gls24 family envelope stress response protein [Vagococcus]|uniref:Alkaline shock protein n=1 Tax=Vagococcus fluvialis bH819 TaxID=1255619 RepID=A0A1X6WM81_9ENTE|nr:MULTISPECIES: Asp23/Gls24 family envelope stress response protein [Vagococcus]SLM85380.1 Alkaline shock protein [Vagococcus fluvialis bH819]HCM89324.1 Asp23/Gls24 family envelope stress response protein [Vagococcus sp.]
MAENKDLVLSSNNQEIGGEIVVAPEVLEVIVGIAASKVEGVYAMRGNLASNVTELFGKSVHDKGVSLKNEEGNIRIDLFCYLNYGVSVPKVAIDMQEKVKQQVLYMTDLELSEVNVHVVGVVPEKISLPDLDELFDSEDEEE